jgi:hypothetical protein
MISQRLEVYCSTPLNYCQAIYDITTNVLPVGSQATYTSISQRMYVL